MSKWPSKTAKRDKGPSPFTPVVPSHDGPERRQQPDPLLYSISDAARRLGASERTIWRLVKEKKLYPTYVRSRTMISETELRRYVEDSTVRR